MYSIISLATIIRWLRHRLLSKTNDVLFNRQESDIEHETNRLLLKAVVNKQTFIIKRVPASIRPEKWHTFEVAFDGPKVVAHLRGVSGSYKLAATIPSDAKTRDDGRAGIYAWNCGGVAFDSIELSPFKEKPKEETAARFASAPSRRIWYERHNFVPTDYLATRAHF